MILGCFSSLPGESITTLLSIKYAGTGDAVSPGSASHSVYLGIDFKGLHFSFETSGINDRLVMSVMRCSDRQSPKFMK